MFWGRGGGGLFKVGLIPNHFVTNNWVSIIPMAIVEFDCSTMGIKPTSVGCYYHDTCKRCLLTLNGSLVVLHTIPPGWPSPKCFAWSCQTSHAILIFPTCLIMLVWECGVLCVMGGHLWEMSIHLTTCLCLPHPENVGTCKRLMLTKELHFTTREKVSVKLDFK